MSGISGTARNAYADKSTAEDLDKLGHDLRLNVRTDEKIQSGAFLTDGLESMHECLRSMEDEALEAVSFGALGKHLEEHVAVETVEHAAVHAAEHAATHLTSKLLSGAAKMAPVVTIGFGILHATYDVAKIVNMAATGADNARNLLANDALAVGLAMSLDVPKGFLTAEAALHKSQTSGSFQSGAMKVAGRLDSTPDLKRVMQDRFDEGFMAAKQALEATAALPTAQRAAAASIYIQNNFGKRVGDDLAFGLGIKAAAHSLASGQSAAEAEKVKARHVERPMIPTRG